MNRSAYVILALCVLSTYSAIAQDHVLVYGYFATRYEKSFAVPEWNGTSIEKQDAPAEFSYPFVNLMLQQQIGEDFRAFVNLNGSNAGALDIRNIWGEYAPSRYFQARLGKIYRKFGLYNEILDAVPTYYGIEPPEMFDADHLLISRTTTVMLFGSAPLGPGALHYSVSTDNGEGSDLFEKAFPLGFDLRYQFHGEDFTIGASGYTSGGATNSDVSLGAGSPKSGVLPWMTVDSFSVFAGYAEAKIEDFTIQFEYAQADHKAQRDPEAVLALLHNAGVNAKQRERFLKNVADGDSLANINTVGDHVIKTWYVRAGYSFETSIGEVGPYLQWDWYSNPETIAKKKYGGDNEAGVADDGVFSKATVGVVLRPIPQVAVKLDGSSHIYKFHGEDTSYLEGRLDISYMFGL